jgi:nucleotidyltransferase substrate binding protein (TIGR01987 family)
MNATQKILQLEKALASMKEALTPANNLERDGAIQRFEYCYELCWKTMKAVLEYRGISGLNSPRSVFQQAFLNGLILTETAWLDMIDQRNLTVHTYTEAMAEKVAAHLADHYALMLDALQKMKLSFGL